MKPYIKEFVGTADWEPLSEDKLCFAGSLTAHTDNGADLEIRIGTDSGTESSLIPEETFNIKGTDISQIQIKGDGLILKAFGNTVPTGW